MTMIEVFDTARRLTADEAVHRPGGQHKHQRRFLCALVLDRHATLALKFIVDCVTARKIAADVAVQFLQVQFIVERVVINVGMDRPATLATAMIECFVIARSAAT